MIPETFSQEKQQLIKALGARIIHSPSQEGMQGAIRKAKFLADQLPNSFCRYSLKMNKIRLPIIEH